MRGADVVELIGLLFKRGMLDQLPSKDGDLFTEEIEKAVKKFQEANEMLSTGRVTAAMVLLLKATK